MAVGTVTYRYPVAGAVAPTAGQMLKLSEVQADIAMGAGANDDDTDIVHNMDLSATGTDGTPIIIVTMTAQGSAAKVPTVVVKDKDTLTVSANIKGANCDYTARVVILRPFSLIR